jgi:hypothetical protein
VQVKSFFADKWYDISPQQKTCGCSEFQKIKKPCRHLNALGIYGEARLFVPKARPTFSQALSALVKSVRIRRAGEAVYWLVYLDGYSGERRERVRVARRLLIGSAEDGHSLPVMEDVVSQFSKLQRVETDLRYLAAAALKICKVPNWWHPDSGGADYIYSGMVGQRFLWHFPDSPNLQNTTELIEQGIAEGNKPMALAGVMGLSEVKMGSTKQAEFILSLASKLHHPLAERLALIHLKAKSALSYDNNFLCQAAWMMAGGVTPVAEKIEFVSEAEVEALLAEARERWNAPEPIPRWCCDGHHSAGDDPRFMGTWEHMYAACRAFAHYGRLDPEDAWLPEFQCFDGLCIRMDPAGDQFCATDCKNEHP